MPSFQVYSKSRKYGGNCTQCFASEFSGSGWIFGNGFNAFTWFWRLRTSKNQVSTILTTLYCPQLQVYINQLNYVLELPKFAVDFGHLNCIFATAAMIFATRFLKDDLEYILRTERFLVYSCRNIFSPEGCLLRSSVNKCGSRFKTTTI